MFTKTDFKLYLVCPRHLWVQKNHPEEYRDFKTMQDVLVAQQGTQLEKLVRQLFPAGTYVAETDHAAAREHTAELIAKQTQVIYQATAVATAVAGDGSDNSLLVRADFLVFDAETKRWNLYEVKSSKRVKKEYVYDAGFQRIVLERAGIPIGTTSIIHINGDYIRNGDVRPEELFVTRHITDDIEDKRAQIETYIHAALLALEGSAMDELPACYKPHDCPCPVHCHKDLPEYSIYDLYRAYPNALAQLRERNIFSIHDIPEGFDCTPSQRRQIEIARAGEPIIDRPGIRQVLDSLTYPLYFLDYETCNPAIPVGDGYEPYQQLPFQFSVHVVKKPGAKVMHHEYLARDIDGLGKPLVEALQSAIGDTGTVIVWYKPFEKGRNEELARNVPEYADFLHNLNDRVFDLMEIFSKGLYIDPRCKGSNSIKNVMPVIVPSLSYKALAIQEGGMASASWYRMVYGDLESDEKEQIYQDLLEYCGLDTLAMVRIWEALRSI